MRTTTISCCAPWRNGLARQRTARYRCVLALVHSADDPRPLLAQGSWEGRIGTMPAGSGGFGYDPYFIPDGFECTAAELSAVQKNALSHRGVALRALIARLDCMGLSAPPLALYLHFPWCVRKCPYCDFNSHALQQELPQQAYLDALLTDLDAQRPQVGDRPIVSLFLGGGTPSLFAPEALGRLLAAIRERLALAPGAEITLEANPGTIERGRFAEYRAAGINRVSLGAQSFDPAMLERARPHTLSAGDAPGG